MTRSILALLTALLCGCATTPAKRTFADTMAYVPAVAAGQGRIYFYVPTWTLPMVIPEADVKVNGNLVGRSMRGGFFFIDRPAGPTTVVASAKADKATSFELAAGETRFVTLVPTGCSFWSPTTECMVPLLVTREVGETEVAGCSRKSAHAEQVVHVTTLGPDGADLASHCTARNDAGSWTFEVPGMVRLTSSMAPLVLSCLSADDRHHETAILAAGTPPGDEAIRRRSRVGRAAGIGTGVAAATAAAVAGGPMGAALAPGLLLSGTATGAGYGGAIGAMLGGPRGAPGYPARVVIPMAPDTADGEK